MGGLPRLKTPPPVMTVAVVGDALRFQTALS